MPLSPTLVMQNVWKVTKRLKSDLHYEWVLKSLYSSNFSWTIRPNFRRFEVIFHPRIKSIISPMKWSTSTNITVIDYISKGFGYVLKLHHKFRLDFRQRYFTAANSFKYWDWNSDVKGLYLGWSILKWITTSHLIDCVSLVQTQFQTALYSVANSLAHLDQNSDAKGLYHRWSILKWMTNP